jgi:hypothetical protein
MDYRKHYDSLINRSKTKQLEEGTYFEIHHIIPRSEGGTNDESNLVKLTAREHFIAHWLLYRENPKLLSRVFSFWRMCNGKGKVDTKNWIIIPSRAYEEGKLAFSQGMKTMLKGKKKTKEHAMKVGLANRGKKRTPEAKQKMSQAAKNRPVSEGFFKMLESRKVQDEKQKKPIMMLDKDTEEVLKTFSSLKEAAEYVNRDSANITVAEKKRKTSAGYKWKYK